MNKPESHMLKTRLKDCEQKSDFKMETLIIHTIFARKSGTNKVKHHPKT